MLHVRGMEVSYGESLAVKGIDFAVEEGELVAVIGANGAGKSTILRTVMGLVKCRKGGIFFEGKEITSIPAHSRARLGISLTGERGAGVRCALITAEAGRCRSRCGIRRGRHLQHESGSRDRQRDKRYCR